MMIGKMYSDFYRASGLGMLKEKQEVIPGSDPVIMDSFSGGVSSV